MGDPAPGPPPGPAGPVKPTPSPTKGPTKPIPTPTGGTATPAPPPSLESPKALNTSGLAGGLDLNLLWVLLLTLFTGGVGGVVYELLILQGNIEWPHTPDPNEITDKLPYAIPKYLYDLGIFARIIIGAAAALAALLILTPSTTITLLATSLVAGSAGTSVFRSIQDRLLAALAQREAADQRTQMAKINVIHDQVIAKVKNLKQAVAPTPGPKALAGVGMEDLDEIEKSLSEAKGLGS
jgi:hypothetical protein